MTKNPGDLPTHARLAGGQRLPKPPTPAPHAPDRERRRYPRKHPEKNIGLTARIKLGLDASVVDLSVGGVLVETRQPLRPGTAVEIRLVDNACTALVRGEVLRSTVSRLMPTSVWYRGAIEFEHPLSWPPNRPGVEFVRFRD